MTASPVGRWVVGWASRRRLLALALSLAAAVRAACSGATTPSATAFVARPEESQWPEILWRAAPDVQEAYRFAVANPRFLEYLPCYCGCVDQGPVSNKDCHIDELRPDGSVVLDPMSFGWAICVGIARDAMRLKGEGKSLGEIRSFVDQEYRRYGPGRQTPPPPAWGAYG